MANIYPIIGIVITNTISQYTGGMSDVPASGDGEPDSLPRPDEREVL